MRTVALVVSICVVGSLTGYVFGKAVIAAQEQPAAGDRRGDRCFDGRMWKDCGAPPVPIVQAPRIWLAVELPAEAAGFPNSFAHARIDVIELNGVCLYVARSPIYREGAAGIAAVSKAQLPKGTGCQ